MSANAITAFAAEHLLDYLSVRSCVYARYYNCNQQVVFWFRTGLSLMCVVLLCCLDMIIATLELNRMHSLLLLLLFI